MASLSTDPYFCGYFRPKIITLLYIQLEACTLRNTKAVKASTKCFKPIYVFSTNFQIFSNKIS